MSEECEEWRPVAGYEGLYEVSSLGRVKSLARVVVRSNGRPAPVLGLIRKSGPDRDGYMRIGLRKNGDQKWPRVHRLVAIAFLGEPELGQQVNHKDLDKMNNCVENLEWVSPKENQAHSTRNGNVHGNPKRAVVGTDDTRVYKFESASEAGRWGFTPQSIVAVLKGRKKTHAGLVWHYADGDIK